MTVSFWLYCYTHIVPTTKAVAENAFSNFSMTITLCMVRGELVKQQKWQSERPSDRTESHSLEVPPTRCSSLSSDAIRTLGGPT